jgi:hypothetical protein
MAHHFLFTLTKIRYLKLKKTFFEYFNLYTIYNVISVKAAKQCISLGEISPNFDLKNMISTYTKDFP